MTNTITANGATFTLTYHAAKQALAKGYDLLDVLETAAYPSVVYANGRYENQMRHIRGEVVAIVDVTTHHIITIYANVRETAVRADQTDRDAQRYARQYVQRHGGVR